jgi:6-phosphogluconolactonase
MTPEQHLALDRADAHGLGEPEIVIVADGAAASLLAAERIAARLRAAVEARGRADWATTGGSNPIGIYRAIMDGPLRDTIPWGRTHVWWGDDRYVPRDHPLSNVKPFDDIVLSIGEAEEGTGGGGPAGVPLPADHVHPFPTGEAIGRALGNDACAAALADELRAAGLPQVDGWPAFDLILVGIGGDGHLFSVFPRSPAIGAAELAMGIPAPTHIEPHVPRVTLNPTVLRAASDILVVVLGASKATILADVFGAWDPVRLPAQFARREGATWILDEAAAAQLPG